MKIHQRVIFTIALATALITSPSEALCAEEGLAPTLQISSPAQAYLVGEPFPLDFAVTNAHSVEIPSQWEDSIRFADRPPVVYIYRDNLLIAAWGFRNPGKSISHLLRDRATGMWLQTLVPGESLNCRKLVLPLEGQGTPTATSIYGDGSPLPPGRYRIEAATQWPGLAAEVRSNALTIDIKAPSDRQDQQAAELIDSEYADFMCQDHSAINGLEDGTPTGTVKTIMERFPRSLHAQRAETRRLELAGREFLDTRFPEMHDRQDQIDAARSFVVSIDAQISSRPQDPLAGELLWIKFQLLRRLDDRDAAQSAVEQMKNISPYSAFIDEAESQLLKASRDRRGRRHR